PRRAQYRAQGRCVARDLLSGVARARRHHRFRQGHQYRSAARAVRQHSRDGRPDTAGDRLQCHDHAAGNGRDLPAAGDRMRRSGVPAHGQPRRCARASGVPGAGRDQSRQRLSRARHAARRRADDPARRHRAVLVARHHRHDLHRGRKRHCLRLCRAGAVVPDQDSVGPGGHPDRGRDLRGLAVVRPRQRSGPADVPRPSPRGVAMIRFWLIVLAMLAVTGPTRAADRLNVVASFSIIGDFVRNVGGDRVDVTTLVGPNSDAHVYVPTPSDAKKVADAKLVFVNGLGFEGWLSRLVKSAGGKASVVTTTSGIAPLKLGSDADPHAWQSVANAKIYVANIRDALAAVAPADAEAFKSRADAYLADLDALERDVREAVAKLPEGRRKVISTHNAFGYFAAAYGIEFIAPLGVSTESEASARDIAAIITQIRAARIPAVFLENITDPRLMGRISAETGARVGGTLYSDSLTGEKGDSPTYIAMVRHNIKALTSALSP